MAAFLLSVACCLLAYCARTKLNELIDSYNQLLEWCEQLQAKVVDTEIATRLGKVVVKQGKLMRSTNDAAAYDLYATEDKYIPIGGFALVKTGVITEMTNVFGLIRDRSGLAWKSRVTTRAGVIDAKYPDEWGVVLVNEGDSAFTVKAGDRIAQVIFLPMFDIEVAGTEVFVSEDTRTGGFGSTDAEIHLT